MAKFDIPLRLRRRHSPLEILRSTILLDAIWYRESYADLRGRPIDAARHYLEYGAREGRNPHPLFDTKFYLAHNPDVANAEENPVVHYVCHGAREGRNPHPLFDTKWYSQQAPELASPPTLDALTHYLTVGWKRGLWPSQYFDPAWYLETHADVRALGIEPLSHYLTWGWLQDRSPTSAINPTSYRARFNLPKHVDPLIDFALCGGARAEQSFALEGEMPRLPASEKPATRSAGMELPFAEIEKRVSAFITARTAQSAREFQASAYEKVYPDVAAVVGRDNADGLLEHWQTHGYQEGRTPFGYRPYVFRRIPTNRSVQNNINYFGFLNAPTGLGSAARAYVSTIQKIHPISTITVTLNEAQNRYETGTNDPLSTDHALNIFHINADMVNRFFLDGRRHLLDESYNIGLWVWELAHFREDWASAFGAMDEIWVPSEFCRTAISAISTIPVYTVPYVVEPPDGKPLPRSYFRIPNDVFVFGCIFDIGSSLERKNPEAAVRAFIEAFGDRDDVLLVIKYHEVRHDLGGLAKLHTLCARRNNIRFYGRTFSLHEILSFKALIDCYVSPHRSEGFGLNIAEALIIGKSVIATNYSGNVDFMDENNGFPVDFRLIEIGTQAGPYVAEGLWADPAHDDLVAKMRYVIEYSSVAEKRASVGKARIEADYSATAVGQMIKDRFDELGIFAGTLRPDIPIGAGRNSTYWLPEREGPKITIVVPVYNIEPALLMRCIWSVIAQIYDNWELILHDDGSQRPDTLALLRQFRGIDSRIKLSFSTTNQGIAAASTAAIALSSGEFIGFLDNDDELAPDALAEVVAAILANKHTDLLYSDEDKIDGEGRYCDHYYKPDWSPEHLESVMYLLHFLVIRRSTLLAVGGMREQFTGAQDYDLALRATRASRRVIHIPKILYHWRKLPGSAAATVNAKPYALENGKAALQDYLRTCQRDAAVFPGLIPGHFRVRDTIPKSFPVTLAIIAGNAIADIAGRGPNINIFDHFLTSILEKTKTCCSLHILVADDGNFSEEQRRRVHQNNGKVISYDGQGFPFNFSRKVNFVLRHVKTDLVILLNDDMEVITPDWVDALVEVAQRPTTGVVGARLLYPDNRIQHCGMVLGIGGHAAHVYHGAPADFIGYNGYTHIIRNYLAVTGACMATRMSLLDEIGWFDEALPNDYNDTDLCLRAYSAGYRNVYTPFAQLYHFERTSLKRPIPNRNDHMRFVERWKKYMENDPYYNVNLTKSTLDFSSAP